MDRSAVYGVFEFIGSRALKHNLRAGNLKLPGFEPLGALATMGHGQGWVRRNGSMGLVADHTLQPKLG